MKKKNSIENARFKWHDQSFKGLPHKNSAEIVSDNQNL